MTSVQTYTFHTFPNKKNRETDPPHWDGVGKQDFSEQILTFHLITSKTILRNYTPSHDGGMSANMTCVEIWTCNS